MLRCFDAKSLGIYDENKIFWAIETFSNLPRLRLNILFDTRTFSSVYLSNLKYRFSIKTVTRYAALILGGGYLQQPEPEHACDQSCSKWKQVSRSIKRNVKTKSPKVREMAYQTHVRPQLEYASAMWDPHTKENAHKIEMVQRHAARWTTNDYAIMTSVTSLLHQL